MTNAQAAERDERVVDCYDEEEQMMGWYYPDADAKTQEAMADWLYWVG
jgi:uncharacterized protein YccT (UPF0319 family)